MGCEASMVMDFFWYSYFGITKADAAKKVDKALSICVNRAYRDLSRTITYSQSATHEQEIKILKEEVIANSIKQLSEKNAEDFDRWHNESCLSIVNYFMENKTILGKDVQFHYGQAQKWLNMTLKNMRIMDLWNKDYLDRFSSVLHVPVDSGIIKAVWELTKVKLPLIKENLPKRTSLGRGAYSYEKVKSWSLWDETEYNDFQKSLREEFENNLSTCYSSLEKWENESWIKNT